MVTMQEDFLPMEGSLLCRYEGMTRCNEQMVKLGKFGREIKWNFFQWNLLKIYSGFCYLKSLKEDRLFFSPGDIQVHPGVRMLVSETDYYIFRMKRIRIGV